ncbi:type IV secretory system conjugative DNA transfer family protein [Anaeromyxobacter terrae]|uniref:type IV secretory system conjugative DNA transfer family protein n=1 Tax=Anaeromyxobacter terrae TaxID=2925406 RepID=UPI001F5A1987|nr:TraM recognition domain-containing protein [Anaeromyxobacter sp. SG22]
MPPDRPTAPFPLVLRLGVAVLACVALAEALYRLQGDGFVGAGPGGRVIAFAAAPVIRRYEPIRAWIVAHPRLAVFTAIATATVLTLLARQLLLFWRNEVVARIAGTHFEPTSLELPSAEFDLVNELRARPPGTTFVGKSPRRHWGRWRWTPVYLTEQQRDSHRHVIGKTGSGKSHGVIWPQVLQDVLAGKGCVVMSGKGSDEEIAIIKAIASAAGREQDLRVFALPAWNQPHLFTHSYNMVHVEPRTPDDPGGDPVVTAERVFSVLPLGDNAYYNTQAQIFFTNLCTLLHGMVDREGRGLPFTIRDIGVCLKGVGDDGCWNRALSWCLETSKERSAAKEIKSHIVRLGRDIHKALSGLVGVVDKFQASQVNAYDPDIVMRDVLEKDQIVYIQLPSNLFKLQAPALGKVFLIDVQQQGSLRQVHRATRNQRAFSVVVDEFARFADKSVVDSLNQLRDAHVQFTLAHQSVADLEIVSREFATAVWDNTRCKDILKQDNPALCELVSKSIGTVQEVQKTVRTEKGPLLTALATREASTRLVESYKLHPNAIKNLARAGQGYVFTDEGLRPVCYGMLPENFRATYSLARKDQSGARGLKLYERFVLGSAEVRLEDESAPSGVGTLAVNGRAT